MNANNIAAKSDNMNTDFSNQNCKVFEHATALNNGGLFFKHDPEVNLFAIIAIHSTALGPALGGCRFINYPNTDAAALDAVRLAKGMSYKSAITGMPLGGGKAVLMKPSKIEDKEKYFKSFAEFVNTLGGKYITAMDSGTSLEEMDIIAKYTPYVASLTVENDESHGDPSPYTSFGVLEGIKAAVEFKLQKESLKDITVAIQGVGNVGHSLAGELYRLGAKLIVADTNKESLESCKQNFKANIVAPEEIHKVSCDVFAPCALGATVNDKTVHELDCKIVAGSANNQLKSSLDGEALHKKGILYAPDYVINSGGLIFAESLYCNHNQEKVFERIKNIKSSLQNIFNESAKQNLPTNLIANQVAEKILRENGDLI